MDPFHVTDLPRWPTALMPSGCVGGEEREWRQWFPVWSACDICRARLRPRIKKQHSRGRRSVFGRELQVYIQLRRRALEWVNHSGGAGKEALDGEVTSNVEEREGNTSNWGKRDVGKNTDQHYFKSAAFLTRLDYWIFLCMPSGVISHPPRIWIYYSRQGWHLQTTPHTPTLYPYTRFSTTAIPLLEDFHVFLLWDAAASFFFLFLSLSAPSPHKNFFFSCSRKRNFPTLPESLLILAEEQPRRLSKWWQPSWKGR